MKENPKAYEWDWDGACRPGGPAQYQFIRTFSVGIFQWLPKAGGKGLKRGNAIQRIRGSFDDPEAVYAEANSIVARLNEERDIT